MEKETTGLDLSGHPMDAYRDQILRLGAVSIGYVLKETGQEGSGRFQDGQRITVCGVVSASKTKTTKNNSLMAYVTLEDDTGSLELLVFSRVLEESGSYIRENNAVLVQGKISVRDEKEPQLMADGVQPLSQLELTPVTDHVNTLYLRLPSREDPRLRKVRLALSFFPGEENVVLYFEDCKKRVGSRCAIRPSLLEDLRERLGEENVVVK